MSLLKKFNNDYQDMLDSYDLPLVYRFATVNYPNEIHTRISLIPSEFYQTSESLADYSPKPISKIFHG